MMQKITEMVTSRGKWLHGTDSDQGIVISSRIRLARNLSGFNFLCKCSKQDREEIQELIISAINGTDLSDRIFYLKIDELGNLEKRILVERHLISRNHAEADGARGVAVLPDESVAIMVNEEDHLRLQILSAGFDLNNLWTKSNLLDDQLENRLEYAFDDKLGYLTACPTNVGTGLRVSVMLHLPALKMTGEIERVFRAARDMHLAVRGLYGEGTEALGDFYQVSNQATLGKTEEEIIAGFTESVVPKIVEYEKRAREALLQKKKLMVEDKVFRALGLLQSARSISSEETLFLLSHLRMGLHMGIVRNIDLETINDLFLTTQPAHLQITAGKRLNSDQRTILRAENIRKKLMNSNNN